MFLSRACEYAIQAILYVAKQEDREYVSVREIAEKNNLSAHFLGKVVQILTKEGLVHSYKGPKGGISLARPAEEINLMQIIGAVDGLDFCTKCLIGLPHCGDDKPCAIHNQWGKIRGDVCTMLESTTVAQLIH